MNKLNPFTNITEVVIKNDIFLHRKDEFVIVYHDNCMDGAVSAAIINKYLQETHEITATLLPVKYGCDLLHFQKTQYVIIVDFCFPGKVLQEMTRECSKLLVIDHHYTATKEVVEFVESQSPDFYYYLDIDPRGKTACGSSLTSDLFGGTDSKVIELAKIQDLWLHDGDLSSDALKLNYFFSDQCQCHGSKESVNLFTSLLDNDEVTIANCLDYGEKTIRQNVTTMNYLINNSVKFYEVDFVFEENAEPVTMVVPVVRAPKKFASVLGGELARHYGVGITYFINDDGANEYSLRSKTKEHNVACHAKTKGGGGHANAAGFVARHSPDYMFRIANEQPRIKFDPYKTKY